MMQNNHHVSQKDLAWLKSKLSELSKTCEFNDDYNLAALLPINDICLDSRDIKPGDVFVALSGFNVHGLDYAYQAERAGAIAVISEPTKAKVQS